jgi:hypothetical protein
MQFWKKIQYGRSVCGITQSNKAIVTPSYTWHSLTIKDWRFLRSGAQLCAHCIAQVITKNNRVEWISWTLKNWILVTFDAGWWLGPNPLWKMMEWKSVGMIIAYMKWKINMFETTNQDGYVFFCWLNSNMQSVGNTPSMATSTLLFEGQLHPVLCLNPPLLWCDVLIWLGDAKQKKTTIVWMLI